MLRHVAVEVRKMPMMTKTAGLTVIDELLASMFQEVNLATSSFIFHLLPFTKFVPDRFFLLEIS